MSYYIAVVIGYVWPRKTRCPDCTGEDWAKSGSSRGGRIQYRRCSKCGVVYKVQPIAEHIDRGGDQTEIRLIG
jgi:tRNA(Ile2) C34 agmatinyltransferase TiaS